MRASHRVWWPVLAWAAAILLLTSVPVSVPGGVRRFPHLDKLAHLVLYLGLGWSLGRALWLSGRVSTGAVLAAVAAGLARGGLNEWLQRPAATRSPAAADRLADSAGVSLGVAAHPWPRVRRAARAGMPEGEEGRA